MSFSSRCFKSFQLPTVLRKKKLPWSSLTRIFSHSLKFASKTGLQASCANFRLCIAFWGATNTSAFSVGTLSATRTFYSIGHCLFLFLDQTLFDWKLQQRVFEATTAKVCLLNIFIKKSLFVEIQVTRNIFPKALKLFLFEMHYLKSGVFIIDKPILVKIIWC